MALFFILGVLFIVYGSFALTGEHFNNTAGNLVLLAVVIALGLLFLIMTAGPLLKRLPKKALSIIDDTLVDNSERHATKKGLAICILVGDQIAQVKNSRGEFSTPVQIEQPQTKIDIKNMAAGLGLRESDLTPYEKFQAYLPGSDGLITFDTFITINLPSAEHRLVSPDDTTKLNPLEKQIAARLKSTGAF